MTPPPPRGDLIARPANDEPRSHDAAGADLGPQPEVQAAEIPAEPGGGHAAPQVILQPAERVAGSERGRLVRLLGQAAASGVDAGVRVKVDQAGQQRTAGQGNTQTVDRRRARGNLSGIDGNDALSVDAQYRGRQRAVGRAVDQPIGVEPEHRSRMHSLWAWGHQWLTPWAQSHYATPSPRARRG